MVEYCTRVHPVCQLDEGASLKTAGPMSPVSIKDIARAAGVSHSTVSRALRDSPLVSPETKARIKRLAEEMGYSPSAVARGLVTRRTRTVGMVVTSIADPFVAEVMRGVEDAAHQAGYSVFLSSSRAIPEREISVVRTFRQRRVDGVIVTASRVGSLYAPLLEEIQVPVVLINNQQPGTYTYSVSMDDREGAQMAVDHLIQLGHRRIGYIGCVHREASSQAREAGYRAALEAHGISPDPRWMVYPTETEDVQNGQIGLDLLLALPSPPTAIFCYNDMTAIGVLQRCYRRGIRVPDDLSLVGFDDIAIAAYTIPPLTTVRQPKYEMGYQAMEMVLDLLEDHPVEDVLVQGTLIVRDSCQPPNT